MELMDAIRNRVSVREFQDREVPAYVIDAMLEAARLAPSGGNGQAHLFGIVRDAQLKRQLALAAGEQLWIADAPVVIACCADIAWDLRGLPEDDYGLIVNRWRFGNDFLTYLDQYSDRRRVKALFSNAAPLIPAEHMFLTAVSYGLSACFIGFLDTEKASRILGLPEDKICLFLLPVGYPKGNAKPKEKKAANKISFYDTWKG